MLRVHRCLVVLGALVCSLAILASTAEAARAPVFPPDAFPRGMSYGQWAQDWFTWAFAAPIGSSPLVHPDNCHLAVQVVDGAVFLPVSGGGHLQVKCRVPAGVPIFITPGGQDGILGVDAETPSGVKKAVRRVVASIRGVRERVDGVPVRPIDDWLVHSDRLFELDLTAENVLGLSAGSYRAYVEGWFTMIHPLSPGRHTIYTQDLLRTASGTYQKASVTYRLIVKA